MGESFKKTISLWDGMALYVGAVVGSGILILPGMTAGIAGANALLAWGGMILFSIPLAYTFAFLAKEYPSAGGVSTFVEEVFGSYIGALVGWFYFIAAAIGQFIVPLTGGIYVTYVFHLPESVAYLIAGALLIGAVISNYFGLKTSGKVQLFTSGLIVLILFITILFAMPNIESKDLVAPITTSSWGSIGKASMLIFWSFFGWEAIASLAPEFRHPKRDIIRSTWGAIVIVGVLYFGIALAVIGTHSYSLGQKTLDQAMNNASLAQVMSNTVGINGGMITAFIALIICLGTTNAYIASISRLAYSLAHEGLAPSWLDSMNIERHTPQRAVLFLGLIAMFVLLLSYVLHFSMAELVVVPNSLGIATYILGTAAGVKLASSWGGKMASGFAFVCCLVAYPFVGTVFWVPILVAVACFLYLGWRKRQSKYVNPSVNRKNA